MDGSSPPDLRASWRGGKPSYGGWIQLRDPFVAELFARQRLDWLCFDLQHGLAGPGDLPGLLQAATPVPAFVRVPGIDPAAIGRALDLGASGVIVPTVESASAAAAAVAACRYAPDGSRSWGPIRPAAGSGPPLCIPMVETAAGVERVEEIAATDGVDCIFVGPGDLAVSLGEPPTLAVASEPVLAAIEEVRAACDRQQLPIGTLAGSAQVARGWAERGFAMVGLAIDTVLLAEGAAALLGALGRGAGEGLAP